MSRREEADDHGHVRSDEQLTSDISFHLLSVLHTAADSIDAHVGHILATFTELHVYFIIESACACAYCVLLWVIGCHDVRLCDFDNYVLA